MKTIFEHFFNKIAQGVISISISAIFAFETALTFFIPCFLATILDVLSAYFLARRVHKKYPNRADGKFKSEYKFKIMTTMLCILLLLIIADYVDYRIIKDSDLAVRWVAAAFFFYQLWSIVENWSSENDNKLAKALQRIMVNKMERHLNVPLDDIMLNDKLEKLEKDKTKEDENNTTK